MTDRAAWTRAIAGEIPPLRANKYHAAKCTVDGIRFDSRKEARRYQELRYLEAAGAIAALELQPEYRIVVTPIAPPARAIDCGRFRADFRYRDLGSGAVVIEDAKSAATKTTAYRLRKRLIEAIYGISIVEV